MWTFPSLKTRFLSISKSKTFHDGKVHIWTSRNLNTRFLRINKSTLLRDGTAHLWTFKSLKTRFLSISKWTSLLDGTAPKRPKMFTSRPGTQPYNFSVVKFLSAETCSKIDNLQTISRKHLWRAEFASSVSETSKNGHIPYGSRTFSFSAGKILSWRNVVQNWYFANGKTETLPEGRIRFLWLRNVQKWSLPNGNENV